MWGRLATCGADFQAALLGFTARLRPQLRRMRTASVRDRDVVSGRADVVAQRGEAATERLKLSMMPGQGR